MQFVAVILHRATSDSDGKGWACHSLAKEFPPETPINQIWAWFKEDSNAGVLEIMPLEDWI